MSDIEKELLNKTFTTYNEVTKYFDVKVIMNKNNTWSFKLEKKKDGGGRISKLDLLIQEFFKFKEQQEKFNETIINRFDKLDRRIDNLVKLNNLNEQK